MTNVPPPPPPPGEEPSSRSTPPPPPPPAGLRPPTGYAAYSAAPTPQGKVRRIGGLSGAITILVGIAVLANALVLALTPGAADSAEKYLVGDISETEFTDSIVGFGLMQAVIGLVTIASMILVMIWMYRMASNLRTFGIATTWHPLWAVFGWFLPPLLFVIPFLMLRELWRKSARPTGDDGSGENPVLIAWFALFGVIPALLTLVQASTIANQFATTDTEGQAEAIADAGGFTYLGIAVSVAAGIAWILFVRQQRDRHIALTGER